MSQDTFQIRYSDNQIVNSDWSLSFSNASFVLDGGINMDMQGNANSPGGRFQLTATGCSMYGPVISGMTFTVTIECQDAVLKGTVGGAHVFVPITLSTVKGGGVFVLPAKTTGGVDFSLPVGNAPAVADAPSTKK